MALTIEDGTIVAGAESYVSAADATTYHGNRGNTAWTGTDAVKEAALRKAAQYLDGHYRNRFKGQPVYPTTQPMAWPRAGVRLLNGPQEYYGAVPSFYDVEYSGYLAITTIPQRLKDAQCELALIALSADLAPSVSAGIKREKIDVLETEYFAGAPVGTTIYTAVNNLLADLLKPINSSDLIRG